MENEKKNLSILKKELKSGATLEVWLARFQQGNDLWLAVTKNLKDTDFGEITVGRMSMDILSSKEIMAALWPCMGHATYSGHGYEQKKITQDIFEAAEVRKDFLEIVEEVLIANILPFSEKIGLLLKTTFLSGLSTQASKPTPPNQ